MTVPYDNPLKTFQLDLIGSQVELLCRILPDLIYVIDLKINKLAFISDRVTELLGYSLDDIHDMGDTFGPIMIIEDRANFSTQISEKFHNLQIGENVEFMMGFRHKNGDILTLRNRGTVLKKDEEGNNHYLILTAEDVTQSQLREQTIYKKQQHIEDTERALKFGSWAVSNYPANDKVYWSNGVFDITGLSVKDYPDSFVPFQTYSELIPTQERERVQAIAQAHLASKDPYYEIEHGMIDTNGQQKQVLLRTHAFFDEQSFSLIGTVSDITLTKRYEDELATKIVELERQQAQMEEAESIFKFGSWEWQLGQQSFRWSEGMFHLLGIDSSTCPNHTVPEGFYNQFGHPSDIKAIDDFAAELLAGKNAINELNHRLVDKNGDLKYISIRAKSHFDEHGKVQKIVGVCIDVTQLEIYKRELERQLEAVNKSNRELEQFAYVASHDLQEPLRKIIAFGERLEKKYQESLGDDGRFLLGRMTNAAQRMNHLIEGLLTYSRASRQMESLQTVSLQEVIKQVLEDLELKVQEKQATVTIGDLPTVDAQPVQMRQLFQNLIDNALKFSKKDTKPSIEISAAEVSKNDIKYNPQLNSELHYYKFSVKDNGIGFAPEYNQRIFGIFQRLHGRSEYEGTGLGLAICRKIVETHQGYIEAEGQEEQGAEFVFYLPVK